MNKQQILKQINRISVAFPGRKLYETKEALEILVDVWLDCLGIYTDEVVSMAIRNHILNNTYSPTIADIKKNIEEIQNEWQGKKNLLNDWIKADEEQIRTHEEMVRLRGKEAEGKYGWMSPEDLKVTKEYLAKYKQELKELEEFNFFDD